MLVQPLQLMIDPADLTLPAGGKQHFRAFLFDRQVDPGRVTWTISENRSGGSIDGDGNYQAGPNPGGDVIQAVYRRPQGKPLQAIANVQVIDGYQVNPVRMTVFAGATASDPLRVQKYDAGTEPGWDYAQAQFTDAAGHTRTLQAVIQIVKKPAEAHNCPPDHLPIFYIWVDGHCEKAWPK